MKRMSVSYIKNMLESKYRENMYYLHNEKDNNRKWELMIKKMVLEDIIGNIEEKEIELNGGINWK